MKGFVYRHSTAHAHARAMVSLTNANGSLSEDGKCVVYYLYSKGMDRLVAAIERLYPEEVFELSELPDPPSSSCRGLDHQELHHRHFRDRRRRVSVRSDRRVR